jgi:plastocyanin
MYSIDSALKARESYAEKPTCSRAPARERTNATCINWRSAKVLRCVIVNTAIAVPLLLSVMFSPARAATSSVVIKMGDEPPMYEPANVTIKAGETVEWLNNGDVVHSVTAVPGDASRANDVALPRGAATFDSGFMPPGSTFDYTFTVPGTYRYFCVPHETLGMVGTVVVKK